MTNNKKCNNRSSCCCHDRNNNSNPFVGVDITTSSRMITTTTKATRRVSSSVSYRGCSNSHRHTFRFLTLIVLISSLCFQHHPMIAVFVVVVDAYQIGPGFGLTSEKNNQHIVIFEHTYRGTGGLVLNCPTPLCIGNLPIPKFHAFKELPLMLGCGIDEYLYNDDDDDDENDDGSSSINNKKKEDNNNNNVDDDDVVSNNNSNIPLGDVSPWFWLHDIPDIPGSYQLPNAAGPLYMGGDIELATEYLTKKKINPKGHFKFFRKYKVWESGQLEEELQQGKWEITQQDPTTALG